MEKIAVLVNKEFRERVFGEKYYQRLRKSGEVKIYDHDDFSDLNYVVDFVKGSSIIITSWDSPKIDKNILDVCPDLKAVIHAAGSIKPIITDEFISRNIRIANSAVAIGEGVAETTLGFAISACKGFYNLNRDTHNGLWQENIKKYVTDFYDITIGVISAGQVGRHFIKLLQNFHVDVLVYDPFITEEKALELGARKVELNELLSSSDVISVHSPAIKETENLLNKENLKLIKDGAILINTSRGTVINEQDLIAELKTGRFFACIDVTNPEPPLKDNELRKLNNVVLTPHIAGTSTNGLKRVALHVTEEVERLVRNERMKAEINLEDLAKLA